MEWKNVYQSNSLARFTSALRRCVKGEVEIQTYVPNQITLVGMFKDGVVKTEYYDWNLSLENLHKKIKNDFKEFFQEAYLNSSLLNMYLVSIKTLLKEDVSVEGSAVVHKKNYSIIFYQNSCTPLQLDFPFGTLYKDFEKEVSLQAKGFFQKVV